MVRSSHDFSSDRRIGSFVRSAAPGCTRTEQIESRSSLEPCAISGPPRHQPLTYDLSIVGLNRCAVSGSAASEALRAGGKALCSSTYLGKWAFHDTASTKHDRGHAGEKLLTAYSKLLRATGLSVCAPFQ